MSHKESSAKSRQLCEALLEELRLSMPAIRCNESENWCSLSEYENTCFAFVYHQKLRIKVWCRGEYEDLRKAAAGSNIVIGKRERPSEDSWSKRFPCYFFIEDKDQVSPGVRVLCGVSHPISLTPAKIKSLKKDTGSPLLAEGTINQMLMKSERETPHSCDNDDLPETVRRLCSTYRILRDTKTARTVKEFYNYHCQLCAQVIELHSGKRYAESHHIQPLGLLHAGPDVTANILCVCPTCHAKLDYGVIQLNSANIRLRPEHGLDERYIAYHNTKIFGSR